MLSHIPQAVADIITQTQQSCGLVFGVPAVKQSYATSGFNSTEEVGATRD